MTLFFFKQNAAYDMRISDWSSDVCSSDLARSVCTTAVVVRLSVRAVGVKADDRSYDCASAGREVALPDGVTTDYYAFEHDFLRRVSTRFAKDVRRQPPGTIEWNGSIQIGRAHV